jgi:hypothetical protein
MAKRLRKNKTDKSKRFMDLPFYPTPGRSWPRERGAERKRTRAAERNTKRQVRRAAWQSRTAAGVEKAGVRVAPLDNRRPVLLVHTLEVGDRVAAFEMPNAGSDFIDQVLIVGNQECGPLITL